MPEALEANNAQAKRSKPRFRGEFALHDLRGIGIGTLLCAFAMGKVIFAMGNWLDSQITI